MEYLFGGCRELCRIPEHNNISANDRLQMFTASENKEPSQPNHGIYDRFYLNRWSSSGLSVFLGSHILPGVPRVIGLDFSTVIPEKKRCIWTIIAGCKYKLWKGEKYLLLVVLRYLLQTYLVNSFLDFMDNFMAWNLSFWKVIRVDYIFEATTKYGVNYLWGNSNSWQRLICIICYF